MALMLNPASIGAALGMAIGAGALIDLREAGELTARHAAYPVGGTVIGALSGGALSTLSSLRRRNLLGAVVVWALVMATTFVAVGILGAVVEHTDPQLLMNLTTGAAAGVGAGAAESYWRTLVED